MIFRSFFLETLPQVWKKYRINNEWHFVFGNIYWQVTRDCKLWNNLWFNNVFFRNFHRLLKTIHVCIFTKHSQIVYLLNLDLLLIPEVFRVFNLHKYISTVLQLNKFHFYDIFHTLFYYNFHSCGRIFKQKMWKCHLAF